jgi:hypothetical protein
VTQCALNIPKRKDVGEGWLSIGFSRDMIRLRIAIKITRRRA